MRYFKKIRNNVFDSLKSNNKNDYPASGVYALYLYGEIVYIGQSLNVFNRIDTHISEGIKKFDSYKFFFCDSKRLDRFEERLIKRYTPHYNIKHNPFPKSLPLKKEENTANDSEVKASLKRKEARELKARNESVMDRLKRESEKRKKEAKRARGRKNMRYSLKSKK